MDAPFCSMYQTTVGRGQARKGEEKRELRFISTTEHNLTGSHRIYDLTLMNLRAPPSLSGQTQPQNGLMSCAFLLQQQSVCLLASFQAIHNL